MNVFIIGGTSGIGLALASFYQQKGHRVGVCGRDLSKLSTELPFEKYEADVYVATQKLHELNQNNLSKKPFLVSEAQAVAEISHAIAQKKPLHLFPTRMKWLMCLLSFLPKPLLSLIMYRKAKWMQANN
jgi:3-oxoacyl-[acyl-carrier-protein] reductase